MTNAEKDMVGDLRERLATMADEVSSVLELMDGLATQWGDEAVFRRCRDRLRALKLKELEPMTDCPRQA